MAADWRQGTGTYVGDDLSTYIVKDADGNFVAGFVVGSSIGNGSAARDVTRRSGKIVVTKRRGHTEAHDLPEIVLEQDMTGWWKLGGEVYSAEEPAQIDTRPARRAGVSQSFASEPQVAPVAVVEEPVQRAAPVLDQAGRDLVAKLQANYKVCKGPAGLVLLTTGSRVIVPDENPRLFDGYLGSPQRHAFLRELSKGRLVTELESVPYTKPNKNGFVKDVKTGDRPGYYWQGHGSEPEYICHRSEGVRLSLLSQMKHTWNMAVNNAPFTPQSVLGILTSAGFTHFNARSNSEFELLVYCPYNSSRDVTVLMEVTDSNLASGKLGLLLVSYRITRPRQGEATCYIEGRDEHVPPYIVAYDKNGRARIFKRPDLRH